MQFVRSEVSPVGIMKVAALWDELRSTCTLYRIHSTIYTYVYTVSEEYVASNFRVSEEYIAFSVPSTQKMELAYFSETLVNIYQTSRHHIS
jgi:hypothetical protein